MLLPERQQQFYQQIHHDNKFVVTNSLINVIYKCFYYDDVVVVDPERLF